MKTTELFALTHPEIRTTGFGGSIPNIEDVLLFPDKKNLAASNCAGDLIILNMQKRRFSANLKSEDITCLDISSSGKSILVGNWFGQVEIWDSVSLKLKYRKPQYHKTFIQKIQFCNENSDQIVASSFGGTITIHDLKTPTPSIIQLNQYNGQNVACSPDKTTIATLDNNQIILRDIRNVHNPLAILKGHRDRIFSCKFHDKFSNTLITLGSNKDHMIWKWDTKTATGVCEYDKQNIGTSIGFFKDTDTIAYSTTNGQICIRDDVLVSLNENICSMDVTSKELVAVGCLGGKVRVFNYI